MTAYDWTQIQAWADSECADVGHLGCGEAALMLLKRSDSVLYRTIAKAQGHPVRMAEVIRQYRPRPTETPVGRPVITPALLKLVEGLRRDQPAEQEAALTVALLTTPNLLSLACWSLKLDPAQVAAQVRAVEAEGAMAVRMHTYALNKGIDLTAKARRGELLPCLGREAEIRQTAAILQRMTKNMPVLVGEPGVGKTAVVEGLVQLLASDEAPPALQGMTVIEFPVSLFTAGHQYVGQVEQFANRLLEELKRNPDVILFLDELHQIIGAGTHNKSDADVAQIFKPALARGEIKVIGATTLAEYRILERDAAFERRMNPVRIEPPSLPVATLMVAGVAERLAKHHHVSIAAGSVEKAVHLAHGYLTHRHLPDTAIDLLDATCARLRTFHHQDTQPIVNEAALRETLAERTGIDLVRTGDGPGQRLAALEAGLAEDVIGQDPAVKAVAGRLRLAWSGIARREKPLGVFLFLGQPGCGKTHLALSLAQRLFGDRRRFLRIDLGEYSEEASVSRLIGASPGYIGHEQPGKLTDFLKNQPFSVVLFDEIEKAHRRVGDVLLSLCGEGRITDSHGRVIDARSCIVAMTSNLGVDKVARARHLITGELDPQQVRRRLTGELERHFRPELLNRLDEVVVFAALTRADLERIARKILAQLTASLAERGVTVRVDPGLPAVLADLARQRGQGARHLQRITEEQVLIPVADLSLAGACPAGSTIVITCAGKTGANLIVEKTP